MRFKEVAIKALLKLVSVQDIFNYICKDSEFSILQMVNKENEKIYLSSELNESDVARFLLYNFTEETCFIIISKIDKGEIKTHLNAEKLFDCYNEQKQSLMKDLMEQIKEFNATYGNGNLSEEDPVVNPLNVYGKSS